MPSLRQKVWQNLNNGLDNGYKELLEMEAEDIVTDLQGFASDMEDYPDDVLLPFVISWLEEQEIAKKERG